MQRILPPPQRSLLLRNGAWAEEESLSELGIYGTFLRKGDEVGAGAGPPWFSWGLGF
jgi:glutathione synthase